jgi:hypothetical protein
MNEILAQGLAAIITYLGPTPILFIILLLGLGPIGAVVWIVFKLNKIVGKITTAQNEHNTAVFERQDKRFEQVVRMYENNVTLVKNYERHVDNQRETNDKLIDLVAISTATQQQLVETSKSNATALMKMIENNEYCPYARVKGRRHSEESIV